jgi:hypothetical protein
MTAAPTSERYRWLEAVREHQARQERIRKLRAELAIARAEGKRIRHANRLRRSSAGDTNRTETGK